MSAVGSPGPAGRLPPRSSRGGFSRQRRGWGRSQSPPGPGPAPPKGFTAVDTFEFNGDGPGWALLPQPGPFDARSSDMVRAAIEGEGGPGAARTTIRRGLGRSGSVRPSFSRRPSPSPLPRLGAPV